MGPGVISAKLSGKEDFMALSSALEPEIRRCAHQTTGDEHERTIFL